MECRCVALRSVLAASQMAQQTLALAVALPPPLLQPSTRLTRVLGRDGASREACLMLVSASGKKRITWRLGKLTLRFLI